MGLFAGLSAFPLTPTDQAGRLKPDVLEKHLERIISANPASIGLLGSTGSYAYLSVAERKRTVRAAVQAVQGRIPLIVGVGALRTDEAAELAADAAAAGVQGLLLAPVSYQRLTDDEVYRHFATVAAAGGLPLCIYNNPGTTHFTFGHNLIARLSTLPNVEAVKMPLPADGDFAGELSALRSVTPDRFCVGYSGDWGAKNALLAGADGWFSVVAGLLPHAAANLTRAAMAGNAEEACRIDQAFDPLWRLFREFGSFRVMYAIAGHLDGDSIAPLMPVRPLDQKAGDRVRAALAELDASVGPLHRA
ncbi:MAG: dihydrodipicolinate synthase family protein [Rhodobacteraceae bacterium]|nr:dihydrodipicolinate synthase family protein [Paracoccaceae bacterium]